MGVWTFIDGIEQQSWEFVSLGISEDLEKIPAVVDRFFPHLENDDSAWTRVIAGGQTVAPVTEEDEDLLAA